MARKALQLVGGALAIALFASPANAWDWDWHWHWDNDKEFSRVVAFGDSIMDSGNRFQYSDEDGPWGLTWIPCAINDWNILAPPGIPPEMWNPDIFDGLCPAVPDDVYSNTFNFTNGRNYVQQVAVELGVRRSAGPAWIGRNFLKRRSNYAIGGAPAARINDSKVNFFEPNLQGEICDFDQGECADRSAAAQVQEFLSQFDHTAPSDALYIVGFGARDALTLFLKLGELLDAGNLFDAETGDFTAAAQAEIGARVAAAVTEVGATLHTLCDAGANTIVLANVPNIAISPAVPPEAQTLGTLVAGLFNAGFEGLHSSPPGACGDASKTVLLLDVFGLTNRYLFEDPELINPATGDNFESGTCLMTIPGAPFGDFDEPCDRYFIHDFVHPTSSAHRLIANELLELIGH